MKNTPLISVIMPAFNAESYIAQSIDSVLGQQFSDFELLVIDDSSLDATREVVEFFCVNDDRVRLLSNSLSKGVSGARNTGIMEAKGQWVAFLDSDDLWYPDTLKRRVLAASQYPECDVFTSDYNIWFPEDGDLEVSMCSHNDIWGECFNKSNRDKEPKLMYKPVDLFIRTVLTHTSVVMVKSDLIRYLGGFDESLDTYEDVLLWLKLSAYSRCMIYIPYAGSKYRQRFGSLTHSGNPQTKDAPAVFRKLLGDPAFREYKGLLMENITKHVVINTYWYRNNGFRIRAIKSAVEAVLSDPLNRRALKNLAASLLLR